MDLVEFLNPLLPLLVKKERLGIVDLNELLSGVEAARERVLVDDEVKLWLLDDQVWDRLVLELGRLL